MNLKHPEGLRPRGSCWLCPADDPALCWAHTFTHLPFPNNLCSISHLYMILLLHLLSLDWVLHSRAQHSKEEGGEEGAEVEGHPGDGVGHHNFLPLPVHRLHNLIGQDWRAHAMGHLPGDNCGRTDTFSLQKDGYSKHLKRVMRNYNIFSQLQKTNDASSAEKHSPFYLFPINWNTFVMIFHVSIHFHTHFHTSSSTHMQTGCLV